MPGSRPHPAERQGELAYARAASREDVEDVELEHMDTTYRTPFLRDGLLVHVPYTTYAHWYLVRHLLDGAGVERVQAHFDIDSMSRAAFLCSFLDAIKAKRAHGSYVRGFGLGQNTAATSMSYLLSTSTRSVS